LLAHARRAGTLMIAVGVMAVVCGLFLAYRANESDLEQLAPTPEAQREAQQQIEWLESQTGISFHTLALIVAFVPLAIGALVGGVGFYVRGGSLGWTIAGMILVGVMALMTAVALLLGVIQGAAGAPIVAVASVCQFGLPLALLVILFIWLVQAVRAASGVALARKQYEAQLWQYQHYQQAYLQHTQQRPPPPQQGLGYGYPPSPAPPPADASPDGKEPPDGASPPG
jgi:hypothetical protein